MQPLFTSLQGHRCASSTVWKIASETSTGEASAAKAKFYSNLFRLNFGLLGIYATDWPILGGSYADIYAIFHAVVHLGGIFNLLVAHDSSVQSIMQYVYILPNAPKKSLIDLFTLLKWNAMELNNVSFIHSFVDTYIRIFYLVYSAWQGAFLRPYIGTDRSLGSLDFLDEAENNADTLSQIEEPEEEEPEEEDDDMGKPQRKPQGKLGKAMKDKDFNGTRKEPDLKMAVESMTEASRGLIGAEPDEDPNAQLYTNYPFSASAKEEKNTAQQPLECSTNILPDICTCINTASPNPTASAPVTNYNRTGYHLNQITTLPCYDFGISKFPIYNDQQIPMTDTSSIKGQKIYTKKELCALANRGLNSILNCSWLYSPHEPVANDPSRPRLSTLDKVLSDPVRTTFYEALPPGVHPVTRQRLLGDIKIHLPLIDQSLLESSIQKHAETISQLLCILFALPGIDTSESPLVVAEKLELHFLEIYNLFLCDNELLGAGENLILTSPVCLLLIYSVLSDDFDSFITSYLRYSFKPSDTPLSLRMRLQDVDIRIYGNILALVAHIFSAILPRLNSGTSLSFSPDNVYFTLSSQHIGDLDSICNNLLAQPTQQSVNLLIIILASLLHRQSYTLNNRIIYNFCLSRPILFKCITLTLLSNNVTGSFTIDALKQLIATESRANEESLRAQEAHTDSKSSATFADLEFKSILEQFGNRLAYRSYMVHNSLILIRTIIYNDRFDGHFLAALSSFLRISLERNKQLHALFPMERYGHFSAMKLFNAALVSTCYGCIDVIRPQVVSGLSAEAHVLLLELLSDSTALPAKIAQELNSLLSDKVQ